MRQKTNLKAGQNVGRFLNQVAPVLQETGAAVGQAARSVTNTVTNPKFWTWPW